jgi:cytochrome P450
MINVCFDFRLIKIISHRCHEPILYVEPVYRVTRNYYREKKYRKRCYNYLDQVLKERRELIAPINNNDNEPSTSRYQRDEETGDSSTEHKNFIDQLILCDGEFSDEEIHDHIYTFVAAGYETSALQTAFTLLLLAIHEDVQEKAFREIIKMFPNDDIIINQESLGKMKYLDMVVKESMRLLPPVPLIGRETHEDFELNELIVPTGVTLLINFFTLHRRKDIWGPDAESFNPERFTPENEAQRPSNCFLPFSDGQRNCIGKHYAMLAIQTILVKFLRSYKVSTDLKYEELKFKADITLKICEDLIVKIEKR